MKIAFFGTPAYAVPTLDALVRAGHDVVTAVCQPDKPVGRGQAMQSPPVALRARELGIRVRQPLGLRSGPFNDNYRQLDLDVAVVVAYGRILPASILFHPRRGSVNGHGSLLPTWRGAAPIQRAILAGDRVTGVTTMRMDEGLDTGDMLLREELEIGPEESSPELAERLSRLTAELIVATLHEDPIGVPQDHARATHAPPLRKEEGLIDWKQPSTRIFNQVRGLAGWPGTFTATGLKVLRARLAEGQGEPGLIVGPGLTVACGEGALEILEAQAPGRKAASGKDLLNGLRLRPGDPLP